MSGVGIWSAVLIGGALFVDVPVPFAGSVLKLVAVPTLFLLIFGRPLVTAPRVAFAGFLFPAYFLLPALANPKVQLGSSMYGLVDQLITAGVALLLVRQLATGAGRRSFADVFVVLAAASGILAALQRVGVVPPLGRDLWGRATTATGDLRGSGLLSDPNFLAVLLAASIPVILQWRVGWLRPVALVSVAAGLLGSDSRAGIILAVGGVILPLVSKAFVASGVENAPPRGRRLAFIGGGGLLVAFAANVGEQRDRVVEGFQVALFQSSSAGPAVDAAAAVSASDRRSYAEAWLSMGVDRIPWGGGVNAQDFILTQSGQYNAAHNNFIQLFGQGGVVGLIIAGLTVAVGIQLFFRRTDPFASAGLLVVAGGLFLSYPGTALLVFPIGVADAVVTRQQRRLLSRPVGVLARERAAT